MTGPDDVDEPRAADLAALAAALVADSVAVYRAAAADHRGPASWDGPTPAGDGDPGQADVIWLASMTVGETAHRWRHPAACPATVKRRGGWTMPLGKARDWLDVKRCPRCWPPR